LSEIGPVLRQLDASRLSALLGVNAVILVLFGSRWRFLLDALGWRVPWLTTALYRLAGYGVSYFTPGPQFGGEPLMIYLLHRRRGIPGAVSSASVALDRGLEWLTNSALVAAGGIAVAASQISPSWPRAITVGLPLAVSFFPATLLAIVWWGGTPISWLLSRVPPRLQNHPHFFRLRNLTAETEEQITSLMRRRPRALAIGILIGGLSWGAQFAEYWLSIRFLGLPLGPVETLAAMTAARLAILLPVPGAAGVLEASQVLALQALGYGPAAGIALGLLIRARDLLIAGSGLWLASALVAQRQDADSRAPEFPGTTAPDEASLGGRIDRLGEGQSFT
jgi:uncharacterized protein (TIRG00374 family)